MAGKKRDKNSTASMKNNPFKVLKGLSVPEPKPDSVTDSNHPAVKESSSHDEPVNFFAEMNRLRVKQMENPLVADDPVIEEPEAGALVPAPPASDEELFVAALGKLDTVFTDRYPEEDENASPFSPRRMKQLRQGKLFPEATLDLHGLTRDEARSRVRYFLENAVYHGMKTVLIVTGWGKGSEREPVLRGEVERCLSGEGRTWAAEWGQAPRQYGGEGALAVFLKPGGESR